MIIEPRKEYEKPDSGEFNGTIIDIVDLGKKQTQFGPKLKLRIVWVLGLADGSGNYALDSEGNPFGVVREVTQSVDEKSRLYDIAKSVLGTTPPVPFDTEILIGRSNRLFVEKGPDPKTGKMFSNVKFITALSAGHKGPAIPQGFVRAKDRPANTYKTAAPATAQAQPAPQPVQAPAQTQTNPAPAKVDAAF